MKWEGVIAGLIVAGINGAVALAAVRWGLHQGMQTFMIAFFGGMTLRLMLVAVASIIVLKLTAVHPASYIVALVVAYLFFLLLEVLYVLKNKTKESPIQEPEQIV